MMYYLSLGSNLKDKVENIRRAIEEIKKLRNVKVNQISSIILTKAWGKTDQEDFLNCAIELDSIIEGEELIKKFQEIEQKLGRFKTEKWGPRVIDIDILLIDDQIIKSDNLSIPHPYMQERAFVLDCLVELCPDRIHPVIKKSIRELYNKIH